MHANLRNFLWALSSLNNLRLHISKLIYCKVHALLEHVYLHVKHIVTRNSRLEWHIKKNCFG